MGPDNMAGKFSFNPSELYARLLRSVIDTLNSPYSDLVQTYLLAGIVLVIVAFFSISGYLIYITIRDRKKAKLPKIELNRPPRPVKEILVNVAVIGTLAAIAVAYGFDYVEQPNMCLECHKDKKDTPATASKHKGIKCINCHEKTGLSGYLTNKLDYMRWTISYVSGSYIQPMQADVSNSSCLRCHEDIPKRTVGRYNIRVSHKEFLAIGERCVGCHANAPHSVANKTDRLNMSKCISCHDNQKVSSKCTLCHPNQADTNIRTARREFIRIDVKPLTNCRSCHPPALWQGECIKCHGLEMPHPPGWAEGGHARFALLNRNLCDRCHPRPSNMQVPEFMHQDPQYSEKDYFCNRCHNFPGPHGNTQGWIKNHGPAAYQQIKPVVPQCEKCHGQGASPVIECDNCHGTNGVNFCDRCHDDGRRSAIAIQQSQKRILKSPER